MRRTIRFSPELRARDKGFTLLEVLVAFFIFTILLGLLYESVRSTASLARRTRDKNRTNINIELAFMKIRQEMISVYINTNDPLTYFIGSPQYSAEDEHDTLLFTSLAQTRLMQNAPVSHLEGVQYIVLPEKKGNGYLLAHEQDTNLLSFGSQAVVADPLLHHIKSFRILYFDGHEWTNQWNSLQSHLVPLLVKMEISIKKKNESVKTFTDVFPIPSSTLNQNQNGSGGTSSSGLP